MKGNLEVIAACMFAGKTEELIRRLVRAQYAKKSIMVFKPKIDNRYSSSDIASHSGQQFKCYSVENISNVHSIVRNFDGTYPDIVAIDEAQFFDERIFSLINTLINQGVRVIIAGLDQDFRGRGFGVMPELMAIADDVVKLKAVCVVCGEEAGKTQRLINGEPAPFSGETVIVGATEQYEARCRNCHERR